MAAWGTRSTGPVRRDGAYAARDAVEDQRFPSAGVPVQGRGTLGTRQRDSVQVRGPCGPEGGRSWSAPSEFRSFPGMVILLVLILLAILAPGLFGVALALALVVLSVAVAVVAEHWPWFVLLLVLLVAGAWRFTPEPPKRRLAKRPANWPSKQ